MADPQKKIVFNGIDGSTGKYSTPPMTIEQLAEVVRASYEAPSEKQSRWFDRVRKAGAGFFAPMAHLDPTDLADVGWGVIFPHDCDPAIVEALQPLISMRQKAAGELFKAMKKGDGYRPGETILDFLARHDHAPSSGPVDPELMPYYLLLVGGPEKIPFTFQYQLDVSYAVGRIAFDTPEEYANYAKSVVEAETHGVSRSRAMRFFGVRNEDDEATQASARLLVDPLFESTKGLNEKKGYGWAIERSMAEKATKDQILKSLVAADGPAFLFTASHGMGYDFGDPKQKALQGALLCQDWPGPYGWNGEIPEKFLLAGSDIGSDANLHGLISFHFACFGAGTPEFDDFVENPSAGRPRIAESPFLGALPKRLLSHPAGGAMACVGHIERAWTFSFTSGEDDKSIVPFRDAVNQLMKGVPVGHAMEALNSRFAGVAAQFTSVLDEDRFRDPDDKLDPETLALKWIEHNDARSYVILGDPFVSLKPDSLGKPVRKSKPAVIEVTKPADAASRDPKKTGKKTDKLEGGKEATKDHKIKADKKAKKGSASPPEGGSSSFTAGSGTPGGYSDITNFTFADSETGRRVTMTASSTAVDPAYPYQAAWEHVSKATRLLGARDVTMGEAERDESGRIVLVASYVVGEGEETVREHIGFVREPSGHCLQIQLLAALHDDSAAQDLAKILEEARITAAKGPSRFSVSGKGPEGGERREPVGSFQVAVPPGYRLQGTRRFVSEDGRRTVEIDFGETAGPVAKPFGLPVIGARSQFVKVEEVPRFLRSPIRYETPVFPEVGQKPGATAFAVTEKTAKPAEMQPVFSKKVEIGGRSAVVRVYGEDTDADTARAATDDFLERLE